MPEGIKQEYIPPTYGALFSDTYLKTHRQRMQTSLALAQQELQTQQSLLSYYAKKEKEYLEFIEGVGTAGSGGGRKGTASKKFERNLAVVKLIQAIESDKSKRALSVEKLVENEYSAPVASNHQEVARKAALNLSAGFGNVDTAIRGLKGFTSGTSAARVVGVQLYNLMESEAASQGTIAQFNANKTAIRNAIARQVGVAQVATDIGAGNAGERIEQAKSGRRQELMAKIGGDTVDQTEINKLKKQAGMDPTPTSGTTGGKGPSATSLEQEELMASRLTGIQNKMTQLEDSIMEKSTAEAMLKRQREIYQNQYGKKKGSSRAARKAIKNMTPEQRFLFDAIKSSADSTFNPYNYVPEADGSDGGSVNFKAKELMDAIIANRGSGETIDVAGMAAKMDPENAEKIVGLALRGVVTYAKQADPLTETKEKVDVETTLDALEDVVVEKLGQEEIKREELKDAEAKAEAPVDTATPEAMEQGQITPFDQAPKAFSSEEDITNFLRTRTGVPTERVQEILGDRVTEAQAKRITEITTPPTNEELSEVRLAGPKFGEIYFKDPKNPTFGYKFIDDQTVQFVKKDGTVIQKKFGADTPQYTEAVKYYELSKQK